jgi:MFS family permease
VTTSSKRNVVVFGFTSLLNDTASEMAYWVLPAFLVSIGGGPATLGIIEGIAESVASFAKLFSGILTDRLQRRKPVVVGGYAVANVVKPLLALATSWWHVLLIRFADRLAKGVRGAPRDVMIAESVSRKEVGGAFGLLQAMDSAGAMLGPLIALALMGSYGARGVFWAAGVPGFVCIVVVWALVRDTRAVRPGARNAAQEVPRVQAARREPEARTTVAPAAPLKDTAGSPYTKQPLPRAYYYVLATVGLFSLGNSSDMFLVLRATEVGIAVSYAPLLGLVFNATYTAFSWPAGWLSDRLPRRVLVAAGFLIFAAVYAVFALKPTHILLWGMMALYGLYSALTAPVLKAVVAENAPVETRGRAFGVFYFVTSVAALLASLVTGELWHVYGAELPLLLSAGLSALSAVLLLILGRPSRRNEPKAA